MTRRSIVPLFAVLGTTFLGTPGSARSQEDREVARAISSFGLEVFGHVSAEAPGPNVVLSPVSVGLAVALLAEGSSGPTRSALYDALEVPAGDRASVARGVRELLASLNADTTATTRVATSLWADEGRALAPDFVDRARRFHAATVDVLDLQASAAKDSVDQWAREHTEGRITQVMPQPTDDLALVLLNAVYFKGLWHTPFDSARTRPVSFTRSSGDTIQVPTMLQTAYFTHFEHQSQPGLRIPYRGGRFAAYLVVADSASVEALSVRLTVDDIDRWATAPSAPQRTNLWLPRVEHRGNWPLLGPLEQAGAPIGVGARLDDLWAVEPDRPSGVDQASQATFLKIDEEGTEAAAATSLGIVVTGVPRTVDFRVDRPFLFVLRDERTGAVMFVARVSDPTDNGQR